MGTVIGSLLVSLGLDSTQFSRGLTKAERDAKRSEASFGRMGAAMTGALAGLGTGLVLGGLQSAVTGAFDLASSMSEAAGRVGLTVEALQGLRVAANDYGISNEKLESSMGKLNVQLGKLQSGSPEAAKAFAAIGLSAKDLEGLKPDEALARIADRIAAIKDPTLQAAAAQGIFGKSYAALLPLLKEGSAALREANAESERNGQLSTQDAKDLDALADSWEKLKVRVGVYTAQIIASSAQKSKALGDDVRGDIEALRRFGEGIAGAMDGAVAAIAGLGKRIGASLAGVVTTMVETGRDIVLGLARGIKNSGATAIEAAQNLAAKLPEWVRKILRIQSPSRVFMEIGHNIGAGLALGIDGTRDQVSRSLAGLVGGKFAGMTPGAGVAGGIEAIGGVANDNADDVEIANERVIRSFDEAANATLYAIERMVGAVKGGSFLDILSAVVGLGMQLGSIGVFGKGVANAINLPKRAMGGPVSAGSSYLVGERGPEILTARRNAHVIPNHEIGGRGGNTYHFQGNMMTPEFWQAIQAGDIGAAQAGAKLGASQMSYRQRRRVA